MMSLNQSPAVTRGLPAVSGGTTLENVPRFGKQFGPSSASPTAHPEKAPGTVLPREHPDYESHQRVLRNAARRGRESAAARAAAEDRRLREVRAQEVANRMEAAKTVQRRYAGAVGKRGKQAKQ